MPLNETDVVPSRGVPWAAVSSPTKADVTLKPVTAGGRGIVLNAALASAPSTFATTSDPTAASSGTVVVILVGETIANVAGAPPNETVSAPAKPAPSIVTAIPGPPP